MKVFRSLRLAVAVVIVPSAVIITGYQARRVMRGDIDFRLYPGLDKRFDEQTLAPRLLDDARQARQSGDAKEALRLLTELQRECPNSFHSSWGLVIMAEMVSKREAPAEILPQIYASALASRDSRSAWERAKLLPYLREMDGPNGWKLGWQLLLQAYGPGGQGTSWADAYAVRESEKKAAGPWQYSFPVGQLTGENVLTTLTDVVRQSEGEQAVSKLLEKVLETPALAGIGAQAAGMLLQQTEASQGAETAATLARKLARERSDTAGGEAAFEYACNAASRLRGDEDVLAFLQESAQTSGDGAVQKAARSRLAAHFVEQNDVESAVAVYCVSGLAEAAAGKNAGSDAVLTLSPQALEQAADSVAKAANRKDVTAVGLLEKLAYKASERKLPRICGALYERAGFKLHAPELKTNDEVGTPFAEGELPVFWQGYIFWHSSETDKGREMYEQLLPKYEKGWQVAQMLYDLAKGHMAGLRYEDAVTCAERGVKALPENAVVLALRKDAQTALEKDKALSDQINALRKDSESAVTPSARSQCCIRIAQAELDRKHYDDALKAYHEVWEKYPETGDAPKAMYAAAEILAEQAQDKRAAKEVIENLVVTYPSSDLSAKAFALLKTMEGK